MMQDFLEFVCFLLSEKSVHVHLIRITFLVGHRKDWCTKKIIINHQADFPEDK